MSIYKEKREPLAFKNPNRAWVINELLKLNREWEGWAKYIQTIEDHSYDKNRQAECFADGVENIDAHDILRTKTLTFLDNNIQGHNFMMSNEYKDPYEDKLSRLRNKVPDRIKELKILIASLEYASVPDGFWKEQGKSLIQKIKDKGPEAAAKIAESYLKNPLQSD
ncbi:MAG: hypothetical protein WDZ54_05340 [Sneathiella sp.]